MEGGDSESANYTLPTLKAFVSTNSRSSGQPKNDAKTLFFHPPSLSTVIFAAATVLAFVLLRDSRFNFHCYTQREATPTQKSARKCAATSRDFLRERLQSALILLLQTSFAESPNSDVALLSCVTPCKGQRHREELPDDDCGKTVRLNFLHCLWIHVCHWCGGQSLG